jgi:uncharacterized protein
MPNAHGEFVWYELITADAAKAKAFYDDVVGWSIATDPVPSPGVDYRMINAPDGMAGGVLTLTSEMKANGGRPGWFGYLGVDDVDATANAIVADGGQIQMPPTDMPGVGRLAMVADPQGVPIYLIRGESDDVSTAYQRMGLGHVSWNELLTSDDAAALAFYDKHFNIKKIGAMPMGEMGDYSFVANDGKTGENDAIGAVMKAQPGTPTAWNFYFRVPDIQDAKAKIEAGGGKLLHEPMEVPGGEMVLNATDPENVVFGLVAPK